MNNKKNKRIDLFMIFSKKRFVIPFSVLCALIMWIVIVVDQNPIRQQSFSGVSAVISLENTAASEMGLGITTDISNYKFDVTVNGPNYIVSTLKPDDFKITADVSNINSAGTYTLRMIGTQNSSKSGYSFVSISPSTIDVDFDYIDTKDFELTPKLTGVSASDGLVAESPIPSNSEQSTITIKGPRSIINKIAFVESVADVNKKLDHTQTFKSYVVLYDKNREVIYRYGDNGKVYDGSDHEVLDRRLSLSFTTLNVTQPISKKKIVSVTPVFSDLPEGITASSFAAKVNISTVTIIGTPDVVEKMTTLNLSPINLKNVSSTNVSFEISPNLPEGVKLVDSIDYFVVTLDFSKYMEKTISVSDIRFKNVGEGLTAYKNSSIKNVKVCGPINVISSLNDQEFYVVVDLAGKNKGEYTVDATIYTGKYKNVWIYGSYTVSVTVE